MRANGAAPDPCARVCVCGQVSAPHLIRAPRGWPWVPAYLVPNGRKQSHNAGVLLVGIRQYGHLGGKEGHPRGEDIWIY